MAKPQKTSHELTSLLVYRIEEILGRAGVVLREYERDEIWAMVLDILVRDR